MDIALKLIAISIINNFIYIIKECPVSSSAPKRTVTSRVVHDVFKLCCKYMKAGTIYIAI